jgi:hypothetical protein
LDYTWWGSVCDHGNQVALNVMLNLPCDLFQLGDTGGKVLVIHDGLEDGKMKVDLSGTDSTNAPCEIMVVAEVEEGM